MSLFEDLLKSLTGIYKREGKTGNTYWKVKSKYDSETWKNPTIRFLKKKK